MAIGASLHARSTHRPALPRGDLWLLAVSVAIFSTLAAMRGPDTNWDLRNYHLYNAYAALHGRLWFDIGVAQLQSYHQPLQDILAYLLRVALNDYPRIFNAIWSIPHGIAVYLSFRICLLFVPSVGRGRIAIAILAVAFGATGACTLPTLAGTMSEMIPTSLMLGGLLLLLTQITNSSEPSPRRMMVAGLLFGIALALKLVNGPYFVGLATAALIALPNKRLAGRFIIFAGFAALAVGGPWWVYIYIEMGNPIFPFFNGIFRSPYYPFQTFRDAHLPTSILEAIFFPFTWAFTVTYKTMGLYFRDPRFAIASVAMATFAASRVWRPRTDRLSTFFAIFFLVSWIAWEAQFSVTRYTAPLELLAGCTILLALRSLEINKSLVILALFVPMIAVTEWLTIYPEWGQAKQRDKAVAVTLPPLAADALVITIGGGPMAYVVPFAPPSVRFLGMKNNFIRPGTLLEKMAKEVVASHRGDIWDLEETQYTTAEDYRVLAELNLKRGDCVPVISNLDDNSLQMCRLSRQ